MRLSLLLGIALLSLSFGGCAGDQVIPDAIAKHVTFAPDAVTLSPDTVVYFGEGKNDSACLVAHENEHKEQAKEITDALVAKGAIYDDEETRAAAWIAIYAIDWLVHQADNRFELGAREASAEECGRATDAATDP